jgi:hypothetical protein
MDIWTEKCTYVNMESRGEERSVTVKVIKNLERTLLDELENLFRSYWSHRLGVSDGLLQVLGHSVRVKTQEVQTNIRRQFILRHCVCLEETSTRV